MILNPRLCSWIRHYSRFCMVNQLERTHHRPTSLVSAVQQSGKAQCLRFWPVTSYTHGRQQLGCNCMLRGLQCSHCNQPSEKEEQKIFLLCMLLYIWTMTLTVDATAVIVVCINFRICILRKFCLCILVIAWVQGLYVEYWHRARGPQARGRVSILWRIARALMQ